MRHYPFFSFSQTPFVFSLIIIFSIASANAQIKIGLNGSKIESASLLELESTSQGLLLPRLLDTIEINELNPPDGMLVYITKTPNSGLYVRKNGAWVPIQLSSNKLDATTIKDDGITLNVNYSEDGIYLTANNSLSLWNANRLQGNPISNSAPLKGQILEWNGAAWIPVNPFKDFSGMTGLIKSSQLAAGSVTTEKIPDGSISAAKIGTGYAKDRVLITDTTGIATWVDKSSFSTNALSFGKFFIGDVNGLAVAQTISGDLSFTSSGVSSIGLGRVTSGMILDGTIVSNDLATGAVLTDKLQNKSVTLAKLADIPSASFIGRNIAGSGAPEVISITDAKNMLALVKNDVGLANAENTSDANKPISTATQTALNLKAPLNSPIFSGTVTAPAFSGNAATASLASTVTTNANLTGVVTSTGNATAIANGAISNAMLANGAVANLTGTNTGDQTATTVANVAAGTIAAITVQGALNELDTEKAPLASPTFTGAPVLPTGTTAVTQAVANNSTAVATTAYADAAAGAAFTGKQNTLINSAGLAGALADETGTGLAVFAISPTLTTPNLGTPSTLVGTNITGTAAGLTAGTVTTNANLTGVVTSTGNATAIANGAITNGMLANGAVANLTGTNTGDQTATTVANVAAGTIAAVTVQGALNELDIEKAALASPTFTGTVTAPTFVGALTGNATTATSAGTVTTNANLTGVVTSTGNATAIANGAIINAMLANAAVANLTGTNTGDQTATTVANVAAGTIAAVTVQGALNELDTEKAALASPSFTTPTLGVALATSINKVAITAPATGSTLTIADGKTLTASNSLTLAGTDASTLNIGTGGTLGTNAYTSTAFAPLASPTFTGTPTLPTGTIATTQTALNSTTAVATTAFVTTADNLKADLASPTFTGTPSLPTGTTGITQTALTSNTTLATTAYADAAAGAAVTGKQNTLTNSAGLAGALSDETGTGLAVFATSPTLTTPTIGIASATSINKVAITAPATGSTLTIADGKTLTASNSLTLAGTDASTLNIGTGGTLGTNAYTSTAFAPLASPSFTTPTIGVATATTVNKVAITAPATGSTITIIDGKTLTASNTLTLEGTDGSTLNVGTGGTLGSNAFTNTLTGSATLDFGIVTGIGTSEDLTINVTNAALSDNVSLGIPNSSIVPGGIFMAWVSSAGVVTVRVTNVVGGSFNPLSGLFKVLVHK
jgi:hypothetical protein